MKDDEKAVISVRGLVKKINRKTILNGLNLQVFRAECAAIIGPNGSGKTTLLRILSSLMSPGSGELIVEGYRLPGEAIQIRRRVGVVTHQPLLYGDLTAMENLKFYARLHGLEQAEDRIQSVLQQVGLSSQRNDLVRTFSRGMQQRLAIGRAILPEPTILLLDEPFTGLDSEACDMLAEFLKQRVNDGCTVLMTSHDLFGVENLATRFDILVKGRITASITKRDLTPGELPLVYRQEIRTQSAGEIQ